MKKSGILIDCSFTFGVGVFGVSKDGIVPPVTGLLCVDTGVVGTDGLGVTIPRSNDGAACDTVCLASVSTGAIVLAIGFS